MKRLLVVAVTALALPASAFAWGGSYPTGDRYGTSVRIQVSDSYPVDQALPQDWATYLGTLVHGRELARLTLNLVPDSACGGAAGGASISQLRKWQLEQLAMILKDVDAACWSEDLGMLSHALDHRVVPWLEDLQASLELCYETLLAGSRVAQNGE